VDRPSSVTVVAAALAVLSAITMVLALTVGPAPEAVGTRGFIVVYALIGWAVLYFFWLGRNWARILIMVQSVFTILNALMATRLSHGTYLYLIAMAAVSVFLLFYLNRPEVRAWFSSQTAAADRTRRDRRSV
jgi:hypothetical protein